MRELNQIQSDKQADFSGIFSARESLYIRKWSITESKVERALEAYEEAKRVLYDMMNRYKDEEKHREIVKQEILLLQQERDLRGMIRDLKKEKYEP